MKKTKIYIILCITIISLIVNNVSAEVSNSFTETTYYNQYYLDHYVESYKGKYTEEKALGFQTNIVDNGFVVSPSGYIGFGSANWQKMNVIQLKYNIKQFRENNVIVNNATLVNIEDREWVRGTDGVTVYEATFDYYFYIYNNYLMYYLYYQNVPLLGLPDGQKWVNTTIDITNSSLNAIDISVGQAIIDYTTLYIYAYEFLYINCEYNELYNVNHYTKYGIVGYPRGNDNANFKVAVKFFSISTADYLGYGNYENMNYINAIRVGWFQNSASSDTDIPESVFTSYSTYYWLQNVLNPSNQYIIDTPDNLVIEEGTYWTYISFRTVEDYQDIVFIETFNYSWTFLTSEVFTAYFPYDDSVINPESLGNWDLWNFLRDGLVGIINFVILFFQFCFFILVYALNITLFWLLFAIIVPFFNNIVFFWLIWAVAYAIYWILFGIFWMFQFIVDSVFWLWDNVILPALLWIWNEVIIPFGKLLLTGLNWLFTYVLIPVYTWLIQDFLPIVADVIILGISTIEAVLLYIFTGGSVPFDVLLDNLVDFNNSTFDFIILFIYTFIANLPYLFTYMLLYLTLMGLLYIKLIYVKSRGYYNRAIEIEASIDAYLLPVNLVSGAIKSVKDIIGGWI